MMALALGAYVHAAKTSPANTAVASLRKSTVFARRSGRLARWDSSVVRHIMDATRQWDGWEGPGAGLRKDAWIPGTIAEL